MRRTAAAAAEVIEKMQVALTPMRQAQLYLNSFCLASSALNLILRCTASSTSVGSLPNCPRARAFVTLRPPRERQTRVSSYLTAAAAAVDTTRVWSLDRWLVQCLRRDVWRVCDVSLENAKDVLNLTPHFDRSTGWIVAPLRGLLAALRGWSDVHVE